MGTTADKLSHIWEVKKGLCEEINRALVDGAEEVSLSGKFRDYKDSFEEHSYFLKGLVEGSLKTITSPITSLRDAAFFECSSLTSASFPNATIIESNAFRDCSSLTSVDIPNATEIGIAAFDGCSSLPSIFIPNVTSIKSNAFEDCSSLLSISAPSATSIGTGAFESCSSLTSVSLPFITSIPKRLFFNCSALHSLDISGTNSIESPSKISSWDGTVDGGVFQGCSSLTSLSLPGITTLKGGFAKPMWGTGRTYYSVFYGSSLVSISLPNITSIESYAFANCSSLTTLYIGTNTSTVCTLSDAGGYTIPSNVTTIYVPSSLVDSYKSATNWSSFADKIVAYTG